MSTIRSSEPFARIDHERRGRTGLAEAVYGPGKSPEQCAAIVAELLDRSDGPVLLTRTDDEQRRAALAASPGGVVTDATVAWRALEPRARNVAIATAGTADLPVARECLATLAAYGIAADLVCDVGVAGLHRVLGQAERLRTAEAVVVVAGMEGALASVVGG
ncbi:MAG: 1-(5-phosphoribosyl)-5-amino-4-imidazole-carboxylate carboxylase, partial [Acidimicrobiia bacterium]|nr:1-(5-phosphoribosyl)-5-amino-4-imidazole-carboxylate carboxylase [Acidimicrobiia bacterium]